MKKETAIIHIFANFFIIIIVLGLYIGCSQGISATEVNSPYYNGDTSQNKVSIMINVYEGSEYLPKILEILEKNNAKCTFFVGGCWVAKNNALLKDMAKNNEIGNHGYLHKDHKNLSKAENLEEINLCHKLVKEITGMEMNLFAPPSGSYNEDTVKECQEVGYKLIMWSKDTIDWRDKDFSVITKRATEKVKNGDFVLMHPTEQTLKALPEILQYYNENNFQTVTVTENIIGLRNL